MEKLIELLNEYEKSGLNEFEKYNNAGIVERVEHTKGNLYWRYRGNTWSYMVVISKEYGFIKWLVDNDKIDFNNVRETNYGWEFNYYWTIPNSKRDKEIQVERLLMILSIQDEPISFLVSILK